MTKTFVSSYLLYLNTFMFMKDLKANHFTFLYRSKVLLDIIDIFFIDKMINDK